MGFFVVVYEGDFLYFSVGNYCVLYYLVYFGGGCGVGCDGLYGGFEGGVEVVVDVCYGCFDGFYYYD